MPITTFYAAILAVLFLYLAVRVIKRRRAQKVSIGDGSDRDLLRRMRVHANCAEYVPIGLIVMALSESVDAPVLMLHVVGILLVTGRLMHAYGLSQEPDNLKMRTWGMLLTMASIAMGAVLGLVFAVPGVFG